MPTTLSLHFPDSGGDNGPFAGSLVHRAHISASLGALFEVSLTIHSTDAALDPHAVVGLRAELWLEGEPHVDRIQGVIRAVRQLTSVRAASGLMASYYEVALAPELFMARHRRARRVHQNKDSVAIVQDTLATYEEAIPAALTNLSRAHAAHEYTTQYDETDLDFIYRVLSEEHLVSYFDPGKRSALVIVDDVATLTPTLPFRLPYTPPSNLEPAVPVALSLRLEDAYASGAVNARDYDFERPQMTRGVPVTLVGNAQVGEHDAPFRREKQLSNETYEVGRFADDAMAKRDLGALRTGARTVECETNFAMFPGTRFFVEDHPRSDAAGELLVVSIRIHLDDGTQIPVADGAVREGVQGRPRRVYSLRCVRVAHGFVPARRHKPRAIGPETAFVVGATADGQIDVDGFGRVLVEFVWDRRDQRKGAPSRRVRVSQGWAGPNRGFVTLPRIGDEVLIGYDGGDPDQPIVVGRVHNAVSRTPLDLPNPDSTVSVWKSRTVGGDGYNQVLMDDKAGEERLELRAEKSRSDLTLGNETNVVRGDFEEDIGGKAKIHVHGATEIDLDASLDVTVGGNTRLEVKGKLDEQIQGSAKLNADGGWVLTGPTITLQADGAKIVLGHGKVSIMADGNINIESSGSVKVKAGGTVDVDGALITLN